MNLIVNLFLLAAVIVVAAGLRQTNKDVGHSVVKDGEASHKECYHGGSGYRGDVSGGGGRVDGGQGGGGGDGGGGNGGANGGEVDGGKRRRASARRRKKLI